MPSLNNQAPRPDAPGVALTCLICGGATGRLFTKRDHWIRGCEVCGHQCAEIAQPVDHVQRVYNDLYFQGGGAGYPDYVSEGPILRAHGRWYGRLLARYMTPGTLLDVGAAAGFVLQGFLDCGWSGRGIEPNPRMAEHARTRFGLSVDTGTLEQFESSDRYDLVSMIQVIAHLLDPRKAFQVAEKVTRPDGFWLIETWNRESWTARVLGRRWHEYSPPSVVHWFSPAGLQRLTSQLGFREVARGRPAKWISAAHAKSLIRHGLQASSLAHLVDGIGRVIPDRLFIPYPAEDLFWALYRRS